MSTIDVMLDGHIKSTNVTLDQLNQVLCTIIDAKLAAREFPGLRVQPSLSGDTFDIIHSTEENFDHKHIPLEHLVMRVHNTVLELQAAFGEQGEKLFDRPLHIEMKDI